MTNLAVFSLFVLLPLMSVGQLQPLNESEMSQVIAQQEEGITEADTLSPANTYSLRQLSIPEPLVLNDADVDVKRSGISIEVSFMLSIGSVTWIDPDGLQGI